MTQDAFDEVATRHDNSAWARLQGLIAVLALPKLHRRDGTQKRVRVEIEVARDVWRDVDTMIVTDDLITFVWGLNGTRSELQYALDDCPRWRSHREDG